MAYSDMRALREARASQRFPTNFGGQLVVQAGMVPVIIANISVDGAKIRCISGLRLGSPVTLMAKGLEVAATVMWKSASTYGLRFGCSINPLEIVRQNHAALEHLRAPRAAAAVAHIR